MGCDCQNGTSATAVDPCRRVNYSLGMILGVDDFVQESTYHSSHREALSRLALGWGTLSGLKISIDPPEKTGAPLIGLRTSPGAALLPNGKLVHVDCEQCCDVANWVGEIDAKTFNPSGAPSGQTGNWAKAWVTLSFRESKCADVPVPGDPCRTDDKLTAPSRVQDGFLLDLTWTRPDQTEEDAIRDFFQWILSIGVDQKTTCTEDQILAAIRKAAKDWIERPAGSTTVPSDFLVGAPPAGLFYKEELLRSVLRLWNTELRPLWSVSCSDASHPAANTLVLAGLWIPLKQIESKKDDSGKTATKWVFDTTRTMLLDQSERPSLVSLRALQEMVKDLKETVAASAASPVLPTPGGDLSDSLGNATVVGLQKRPVAPEAPAPDDILRFVDGKWQGVPLPTIVVPVAGGTPSAQTSFGLGVFAGTSSDFARADHNHGTPPEPTSVGRQKTPYELIGAGEIILTLDGDSLVEPEIVSSYHSSARTVFANLQTVRVLLEYERRVVEKATMHRVVQLLPVLVEGSTNRILLAIDRSSNYSKEFGSGVDIVRIDSLGKEFDAKRIAFQYQVFEFASSERIIRPINDRIVK